MANPLPTIVTTDFASPADTDPRRPSDGESVSPNPSILTRVDSPTTLFSPYSPSSPPDHDHLRVPGRPSSPGTPSPIISAPPSPTLSAHSGGSVKFQTSLALRDNDPDAKNNIASLNLLSPSSHKRAASNATFGSIDETEPDHGSPLTPIASSTQASTYRSPPRKTGEAGEAAEDSSTGTRPTLEHIDPSKDTTDPAPFDHRPLRLASLVDPKNLQALEDLGGIQALIDGLGTNASKGLSKRALGVSTEAPGKDISDISEKDEPSSKPFTGTVEDRRRVYGSNSLPTRASKSLWMFMWLAFQDRVLVRLFVFSFILLSLYGNSSHLISIIYQILLSIAAVVSLALGLYQDLGTPPIPTACSDGSMNCFEPRVDWVEGVAIVAAILIVVIVGSVNDWQKEKQFRKLNDKKEDRGVKVIRFGHETIINIKDVLVGDLCLLEPGEIIPCDGVFLRGHNVVCDESGATGESDAIKKFTYDECVEEKRGLGKDEHAKKDCFIISGSKVLEGVGEYVVIAVGTRSFNGRIMMALQGETEDTPLQSKLNDLAELIAKLGSLAGLILFAALMIRFFVQLGTDPHRCVTYLHYLHGRLADHFRF